MTIAHTSERRGTIDAILTFRFVEAFRMKLEGVPRYFLVPKGGKKVAQEEKEITDKRLLDQSEVNIVAYWIEGWFSMDDIVKKVHVDEKATPFGLQGALFLSRKMGDTLPKCNVISLDEMLCVHTLDVSTGEVRSPDGDLFGADDKEYTLGKGNNYLLVCLHPVAKKDGAN